MTNLLYFSLGILCAMGALALGYLTAGIKKHPMLICARCHQVIKGVAMLIPTTRPEKQLCADCAQDYLNEVGEYLSPKEMEEKLEEDVNASIPSNHVIE